MATPAIQTLLTDAQQVLNLNSLSEVRATMAAALANANVGTPLNPNLTTQQLWNEFYLIVRQPESDIESIITNQLMKFLFAPPAPGGAGANHEVIYNNNGVLAGDPKFLWDDALNKLDIDGSATITGDLTVNTNVLKVDSTNDRVGILTSTPGFPLHVNGTDSNNVLFNGVSKGIRFSASASTSSISGVDNTGSLSYQPLTIEASTLNFALSGSTAMTLNSTGLGVGVTPSAWNANSKALQLGSIGTIENSNNADFNLGCNYNRTSGGLVFSFGTTKYATAYSQNTANGTHAWLTSTTAGNAGASASFTQAMTLDATGNLLVGTASGSFRGQFAVASGADRNVFTAQVTGASNGFQILWNHATTTTRVIIANIPTSSAGLAAGTLWNDAGTIKIA